MDLNRKTVLITGGARGIGLALTRACLARGGRVTVCGRDPARLQEIERTLPGVRAIAADLCNPADLRRLVGSLDHLDVLVNNAAIQLERDFLRADPDALLADIDLEVRINFTGLVQLTALCLPLLRAQPEAAIVNLTSGLALTPKRTAPVYCASKAAVRSFSRSLRDQLRHAGQNVQVLDAVLPVVDTDMTRGRNLRGVPKMQPDQVAAAILRALERGQDEVYIGRARQLAALHRLLPGAAARIMRGG